MKAFPIIMYHGVSSEDCPYRYRAPGELEWVINVATMRRHLMIIAEEGFRVVLLRDLPELPRVAPDAARVVVLTFDDGHETCHANALPVLDEFGFKAEFFVTAGWTDTPFYMTRRQLVEMHEHGMSIQSHGLTHRFLTTLGDDERRWELEESRRQLSRAVGADVDYISYPGGRHDATLDALVREVGFRGSCCSDRGYNALGGDMFALKRRGVTKNTTDREFRALLTDDHAYFAAQSTRAGMISLLRRVGGRRLFEVARRLGGRRRSGGSSHD